MMDNLIEAVVATIVLVTGFAIALLLWGADPQIATSLISGVTELGVFILVIGTLIAIPISLFR